MEVRWISFKEKKPEAMDADEEGCVMVWHRRTGAQFCRWDMAKETEYQRYWMTPPARPEGEPSPQELAREELRAMGFGRYGLLP